MRGFLFDRLCLLGLHVFGCCSCMYAWCVVFSFIFFGHHNTILGTRPDNIIAMSISYHAHTHRCSESPMQPRPVVPCSTYQRRAVRVATVPHAFFKPPTALNRTEPNMAAPLNYPPPIPYISPRTTRAQPIDPLNQTRFLTCADVPFFFFFFLGGGLGCFFFEC
jgi:hypothetical protein